MFLGFKIAKNYSDNSGLFISKKNSQLDFVISLLKDKYVDSVNVNKLYENGMEGILSSLDPHTVYISPKDISEVNNELEGNIVGIGIEFFILNDTLQVLNVRENSPALKNNIEAGDKILKVNDSLIIGKNWGENRIVNWIKGKENTKVNLQILKPNNVLKNIVLHRETIEDNSITASFVIPSNPTIGYISIKIFSENTYEDFKKALEDLIKQHIESLIIDVRDNPGGYMDAVTQILDELIPNKQTLLSTKSKQKTETIKTSVDGIFEKGKIAILINENAASASEIMAGVVQDLDRGQVVGRRSYGKGLVQEQFPLPNKGALRITVARYYLPSGRCIQKDYSHGKNEYSHEIVDRFKHGELNQKDTTVNGLSKKYYTLNKRVVYGNEGVKPDIFIPLKIENDNILNEINNKFLIEIFANQYYTLHKNVFSTFKNKEDYFKNITFSNDLKNELFFFLNRNVSFFNKEKFEGIETFILKDLRESFIENIFGFNAKQSYESMQDPFVLEAIKSFK